MAQTALNKAILHCQSWPVIHLRTSNIIFGRNAGANKYGGVNEAQMNLRLLLQSLIVELKKPRQARFFHNELILN